MDRFKALDDKIQDGYGDILDLDYPGGCDKWLESWEEIKALISEGVADDLLDLDFKYDWTEFIANFIQDMEAELHNAGTEDRAYHQKRAKYCEELLQYCGEDELLVSNTRRGMAEGYYNYGDTTKCEQLYTGWLRDDPDWGWGYIGWSDCFLFDSGDVQYERAEEILMTGYAKSEIRDKIAIAERLATLYKDMGNPEKAEEYDNIFLAMQRTVPRDSPYYDPEIAIKVGRNEPCPCGSGKKYKKCCGW